MLQGTRTKTNQIFIEARWFNTVGFTLSQDIYTKKYKCYTYKVGGDHAGHFTEDEDINKILAHGSTFPMAAARELFHFDTNTDWIHDHPEMFL